MVEDVVIVGAGAAGIAAARRLTSHGIKPLLIEAAPHPGGRAHSVSAEGMTLDRGCGWLHSADRNPWVAVATEAGIAVDRRTPAWGRQYRNLGFAPGEQQEARGAFDGWVSRLAAAPPASDNAADALPHDPRWHPYITAMAGFISGVAPDHISAADFTAYDEASTRENRRIPSGYGNLIASSIPPTVPCRCGVALLGLAMDGKGVRLETGGGPIDARTVILTMSTAVLASNTIRLPPMLADWRHAASQLPLGRNEKLFLSVAPGSPFREETQLLGDPHDTASAACYIRPFGWPVIECFLGGEGAVRAEREGAAGAFAHAVDTLAALLGSDIRRFLRPLAASSWSASPWVGGGYSCALPGAADARRMLARGCDARIFFAGEATSPTDFSTAHGAFQSGVRAADEAAAALSA